MTPFEEYELFMTDHAGWIRYVAEIRAKAMQSLPVAEVVQTWGIMSRDLQVAVWAHLDADTRAAIKAGR